MIEKINNIVLDGGIAAVATGTTQIASGNETDLTPIIVGVFAPIIKEALFRLIDKIGTLRQNKKARKNDN